MSKPFKHPYPVFKLSEEYLSSIQMPMPIYIPPLMEERKSDKVVNKFKFY